MNNGASDLPSSLNLPFIEGLYSNYVKDPGSVMPEWRQYFEAMEKGDGAAKASRVGPSFHPASIFNPPGTTRTTEEKRSKVESRMAGLQDRLDQLIRSYRFRGHLIARINPLGFKTEYPPELNPAFYGFTPHDMERPFSCETITSE